MPAWITLTLTVVVFVGVSAWITPRLLDTRVGWLRAWLTGVVVLVVAGPVAVWALSSSGVYRDGRFVGSAAVAAALLGLAVAWMFLTYVVIILSLEFLWPSQGWQNPVTVTRAALRRRDRARRYAQILAIGSRHGLTFYRSRHDGHVVDLPTSLVSAMNEAGVTFVKLGQVLSSREDVLPPAFIRALSTLQMDSTPIPWSEAEAVIREELGRPISEVFQDIDSEPLAAASVAQVHAARLLSGDDVVVKIQRPSARSQVTTDLDILERLAREVAQRTDWAEAYGVRALVDEFARGLDEELDYRIEVANTRLIERALALSDDPVIRAPRVFDELSTSRLIVQERAVGVPLSRLQPNALDANQATGIADALLDAVIDLIVLRGVFHADLHPGNVILSPALEPDRTSGQPLPQKPPRLILIDFGSIGVIERSLRRLLLAMLVGIANDDDVAVTDAVLLICGSSDGLDQTRLQRDVGAILTRMHIGDASASFFTLLLDVLRRHRIALPPSLLLVFRTLTSLEGTLHRIDPGYDLIARVMETAPRLVLSSFAPGDALITAQTSAVLAAEQARRLPRRLENVTRSLEEGTLSVRVRTFESVAERRWVDRLVSRIITSAIGIGLVLSSVALGISGGGPVLAGEITAFPVIGSLLGLGGMLLILRALRMALSPRARSVDPSKTRRAE